MDLVRWFMGHWPWKMMGALVCLCAAACTQSATPLPAGETASRPPAFQTLPARPTPGRPSPTWPLIQAATPAPSATAFSIPTLLATTAAAATTRPASLTPLPPTCLKQGGRFETGSLETNLLRLPLEYRVYLPPCYAERPTQRYPVLYLFHGQSFTDDQWQRLGAGQTADRLIAAGEIAPLLIVMPHERYPGQPGNSKFDQAMMEVLLPYIDGAYRTLPDRAHRAIGGLSRGAGWAVHLGFDQTDQFSIIGAHSPAVFVSDYPQLDKRIQSLPPDQIPRVYVDVGERDRPEIIQSARELSDLLNRFNIPYEWHLFFGYHNEAYWSAHIEQYLRWYCQDWQ